MSNLGLERFLSSLGLTLGRTQVGDRYVAETMRAEQKNLGGEQSGHVILSDFATTGDGLVAALQVLAVLVRSGKRASETCRVFAPLPQLLRNVRYTGASPLAAAAYPNRHHRRLGAPAHHRPRPHPRLRHRAADPRHGRRRGFRLIAEIVDGLCATIAHATQTAEAAE